MKKIIFAILSCVIIFSLGSIVFAEESETLTGEFYTGVAEMTDEELEAFHSTLPRIVDVKPNSIALSRLSEDELLLLENIEVAELGEEMVYAMPGEEIKLMSASNDSWLDEAVDVSKAATFPPIGNQGDTGSCLPWAFCYYQLTNNTCLVRNLQAKTQDGAAIKENIMAPGFIYSLVNEGTDSGSRFDEIAYALGHSGCPNADVYALEITDESLKEWDSNINVWYDAMYNKPKKIAYIPIPKANLVDGEADELQIVKKLLSNGYVVTFSTYVASWVFTNKTTTGEYACRYMKNNKQGAHAMTIVGYNDNFWVDINDNDTVDDGEIGAFKLVNSWGYESSLFPNGYAWVPYDAFGNDSVVNVATDRASVMKEDFYFMEPWKNYTPLLVAEVEITASNREHLVANFNVTDIENNEIEYLFPVLTYENIETIFYRWRSDNPLNNPTNIVNFSGATGEETITIPFDLTSIISSENGTISPKTPLRVSVFIDDGNAEDCMPVSYQLVRIVEPMTGETADYTGGEISVLGWSDDVQYVDFQITAFIGEHKTQDITLEFNSDVHLETIDESIYLTTSKNEIIYPDHEIIGNRIIVHSPKDDYDFNTKYELHITKDVISKGGNSLKHEIEVPIYIVTEVTTIMLPEEG